MRTLKNSATMKNLAAAPIATALMLTTPEAGFAHAGHGNEFQGTGNIQRVKVNAQTDSQLGIVVNPIATSTATGVSVPTGAIVDADGKLLAFVRSGEFYKPVEVTLGEVQGDRVEVTSGLSAGKELVTQGVTMLYAQSRKTQAPEASSPSDATSTPSHAQAHTQGGAHSHDTAGASQQSGLAPGTIGNLR